MPTEDYGYGAGKSQLLADYGAEKYEEGEKRAKDIETAGRARTVEQERKSLLSLVGGAVGLAFFGPAGMAIGYGLGKAAGGLGTYGGKNVEDYMVSQDVGMFETQEKYELQDINRDLPAADRADFWGDVADIGQVGALAFSMGGGSFSDPSNFSPWQFGGKEAVAEGGYGMGLFGKGDQGVSAWDVLKGRKAASKVPGVVPGKEVFDTSGMNIYEGQTGDLFQVDPDNQLFTPSWLG